MTTRPIVLAAGGTGGHMFPAEALAAELRTRGHGLVLFTDARGTAHGGLLAQIPVQCIRSGTPSAGEITVRAKGIIDSVSGTVHAVRLLRRLRPAAVIGFGGYPSLPTMLAAAWLRFPTLVHEQNAVLGRVNRLLASRVTSIGLSFPATDRLSPDVQPKSEVVGNPVRPEFLEIRSEPYKAPSPDGTVNLLVIGGSQGAAVFADTIPRAFALLPYELQKRLRVAQQCRPETLNQARELYVAARVQAELAPFFADVPRRLAKSHLVICRAGASTVAELRAAGRPAVLVPFPHAVDDHQTANAHMVAGVGGGWIMPQTEFTPEALAALVERLLAFPSELEKAAVLCRGEDRPEPARALAALAEQIASPQTQLRPVPPHVTPAAGKGGAEK